MIRLNNHIVGAVLPCLVAVMASCGEDEPMTTYPVPQAITLTCDGLPLTDTLVLFEAELKAWEP